MKPITFNDYEVRAVREGRKVQVLRAVKPQPPDGTNIGCYTTDGHPELIEWVLTDAEDGDPIDASPLRCPYGQPGDRLWVRETWRLWACPWHGYDGEPLDPTVFRGALKRFGTKWLQTLPIEYRAATGDGGPWRSPIHMPRWASRLTLEVTNVKVRRVQEMSEADAHLNRIEWGSNPWVWVIEFMKGA